MNFENVNLLDIEFYKSLSIWTYISFGFGILLFINSIILCCYCCSYNKMKKKLEKRNQDLDEREYKINKREIDFQIKLNKSLEKDQDLDSIILTKPALYSHNI